MTVDTDQSTSRPIAWVTSVDIPGLVNVRVENGPEYRDITLGQLNYLTYIHQWDVREDR